MGLGPRPHKTLSQTCHVSALWFEGEVAMKRNLHKLQENGPDILVSSPEIQIEFWLVDRLVPSDVNPRTHSREQVAQIAASIREFGFVSPILVGPDGGIIPGAGGPRAGRTHGLREVPAIVLDRLPGWLGPALAIADNQLARDAGWGEAALREQLAAVKDDDDILHPPGCHH